MADPGNIVPVSMAPSLFVVVSGPPGSGKTTLASELAIALGLPLISKDAIKEALLSELAVADSAASQQFGRVSMAVLFRLAADSSVGAVIEANFRRSKSVREISGLPGTVIEVHCRCSRAVALDRYRSRQSSRHPGHFDAARSDAELWDADMVGPLAGGWPVFEVDTDRPVDVPAVLRAVHDPTSSL
jgi:predicted kinase